MPVYEIGYGAEIAGEGEEVEYLDDFGNAEVGQGGDEIESLVRAIVGQAAGRRGPGRRGPDRRMGPGSTAVVERRGGVPRSWPVPLDSGATLIVAAASQDVTTRPQYLFKPERLVIPRSIVDLFTVDDIRVGTQTQLAANGSIPAAAFAEDAVAVVLDCATVQPGTDLVVRVTNVSAANQRFRGTFIGRAVI